MNDRVGVGIIGTGKHGSRYAHHIVQDLSDCFHLTAISRRSAVGKEQAKGWNTTLFTDWRELVRSRQVEAVISATTPNLNLEIAKLCAAEKKPLLIEKPLATDYYLAQEIVDLFKKDNLPFTVAQTLRYNPVIIGLRQNLPAMGKLFSLSATHRLEPSNLPWLEQPEIAGGGVIFHTAVHLFDALRFITGEEIVKIRAVARNIYNPQLEDLLSAEVLLSNGVIGLVDTSKVSPARAGRYEFVCERGGLQGDQIHGTMERIQGSEITSLPVKPLCPSILPLLEDWYTYLTERGENPISGSTGLAAVKICHACRESAGTDQWVAVGDL